MTRKAVAIPETEAAEALLRDVSEAQAPMVQRLATARDKFDLEIKALESERFELLSKRDHLRRQLEAVEAGYTMHIEDIERTLSLYQGGIGSLPVEA